MSNRDIHVDVPVAGIVVGGALGYLAYLACKGIYNVTVGAGKAIFGKTEYQEEIQTPVFIQQNVQVNQVNQVVTPRDPLFNSHPLPGQRNNESDDQYFDRILY